jgi:hypothetical protein
MYVHVYTLYVHVHTMYVHGITMYIARRACSGKCSSGICIQYVVPMYSACTCIYTVCTCICNVHTCLNQLSQQQILVGILEVYPCMYTMVDSCMIAWYIPMSKAVQESMQWQIPHWSMHTICGTHVQCVYMYIQCMYRSICNVHTCFNQLSQQPFLGGIEEVYPCMYW